VIGYPGLPRLDVNPIFFPALKFKKSLKAVAKGFARRRPERPRHAPHRRLAPAIDTSEAPASFR
jgi:hypothetical protein